MPTAGQLRWDGLIRRRGSRGALRQNGRDRPISVSIQQATLLERLGGVSNPLDEKALISPLDPDTGQLLDPPPSEKDVIVKSSKLYKINAPPDDMGAGDDVLYWRVMVRA